MEARETTTWVNFGYGMAIGFSVAEERWVSAIVWALLWLSLNRIQAISTRRTAMNGILINTDTGDLETVGNPTVRDLPAGGAHALTRGLIAIAHLGGIEAAQKVKQELFDEINERLDKAAEELATEDSGEIQKTPRPKYGEHQ